MTGEIRVTGIVLTSMPVSDYDRRVTILTAERGRITAFAKGAQKPGSAFSACAQSFTYAEFTLISGRESNNLTGATKVRYFPKLREDIEKLYYGMYFCELEGYLTREGADEAEQMKLLYVSLLALCKDEYDARLVRRVFELKAMQIYGEAMVADGRYYSGKGNGLKAANEAGSREVCESTLYTVQYIFSVPPAKLYSFRVTDEVLNELEIITADYMKRRIDRPMKSLNTLESLKEFSIPVAGAEAKK